MRNYSVSQNIFIKRGEEGGSCRLAYKCAVCNKLLKAVLAGVKNNSVHICD